MMYYLKCENCGFLNPLLTEYLVFCTSCQKKLVNNFHDWQKSNPDKTFDDFKNLVAVSETAAAATTEKVRTTGGSKFWIYIAIIFSICFTLGIGYFISQKAMGILSMMKLPQKALTEEWSTQEYCAGFSFSTPSPLTKENLELPEEVKAVIQEMETFSSTSSSGFTVMLNCILYSADVGELDLEGAANGSVEQMKTQPGVTDFTYNEEPSELSGIPGFVQRGTYSLSAQPMAFINAGYANELRLWQMMLTYKQDDVSSMITAEKIFNSMQITTVPEQQTN